MGKLGKQELAAIEAVANHFSAPWEKGGDEFPAAWLTIDGKRIAVDVVLIGQADGERRPFSKPRLRFDKVAIRLISRLQASLSKIVPDGDAIILTVTAPIRLASKTAAVLESQIGTALAQKPAPIDIKDTIFGNEIRVRHLKNISAHMQKVTGFVHNADSDAILLLNVTQSLLQHAGAAADGHVPESFTGERWLVVADDIDLAPVETYRQIYQQLGISTVFQKSLIASSDGRVETLLG